MLNFLNHTTNRGIIFTFNHLVHFCKTQSIESEFLCLGSADAASHLFYFNSSQNVSPYPLNTLLKLTPLF